MPLNLLIIRILVLLLGYIQRFFPLLVLILGEHLSEECLCILRLHLHYFAWIIIAPICDLHECLDVVEDALFALLVEVLGEILLQVVVHLVVLVLFRELPITLVLALNLNPVHLVQPADIFLHMVPLLINAVQYAL